MKLLKLLLVFVFFVIGSLSVPEEMLVLDCAGGAHFRKPGTDFYDQGLDLGILKRTIDELIAIIHEHVLCKCPSATPKNLEDSFTPSLKVLLRALSGYKGDSSLRTSCGTLQLDEVLGGIFPDDIATNPEMPSTCNYAHWQSKKQCSFQFNFPSNPLIGSDFSMYFAFSECPNSIWPHVSISASGSFITSFLQPCSTDSECGTLKCGTVFGSDDTALFQESAVFLLNESLWHADIYKQESCQLGDVPRYVGNQLLNFLIRRVIGHTQANPYQLGDTLSMCGYDFEDLITNFTMSGEGNGLTAAKRHRDTMKRAVSEMKKKPLSQYINDAFDNVKNRGFNLMDTVNNLGFPSINDMLFDASKKFGLAEKHSSQVRSLLQSAVSETTETESGNIFDLLPKPNAWDTTGLDMFKSDRIDGSFYNHFFPEEVVSGRVNLFRINACTGTPAINFLGGSAKRMRIYAWKYPELFTLLADTIKSAVSCRPQFDTLSNNQFLTRFFPVDTIFWLKMFAEPDVTQSPISLGPDGYDVLSLLHQAINEDPSKPFSCVMPSTCTFEKMFNDGMCTLEYNNLSPLLGNSDVKIVVDYRRCTNSPNAFTMSIDCLGADCQRQFDPFSIPCSASNQNSKCGGNGQCQLFEFCDPLGFIWNSTAQELEPQPDPTTGINGCPQDSTGDSCLSTSAFRQRLVQAMLNINQDSTTTPSSGDDGMCIPGVFAGGSDMETWGEDAVAIDEATNTMTIKGLATYSGSEWVENTADGATPRPDGTFVPSENDSKRLSFPFVSLFFCLWITMG